MLVAHRYAFKAAGLALAPGPLTCFAGGAREVLRARTKRLLSSLASGLHRLAAGGCDGGFF
ncbi:hypothetical protein MES5069_660025 [Mesorhizobium escarrei]|uniref:Uncharacterized protein n=1 Tax=Mesorhizobium escarrei TaxID=666018 RepID=A0ABM9EFV6_9HYPH|nr:hypothetical protein MES5069_660025 [Mesorhizobium escarrei]